MNFSPEVQAAFKGWVDVDTWHTTHPLDEKRFFRFVWTAAEALDRDEDISESAIEQAILERWRGKLDNEFLEERAREWASLYRTLLDFWQARADS